MTAAPFWFRARYSRGTKRIIEWMQRRELNPDAIILWGFLWLRLRRIELWLWGFKWNDPVGMMGTVIHMENSARRNEDYD